MATHVLFDFDGTLVNSVDHLQVIVDQIIQDANPTLRITDDIRGTSVGIACHLLILFFSLVEYCPNLISLDALCNYINETLHLSIDKTDFKRTVLTKLPRCPLQLMPGIEKLVKHLHRHGIPMAVASGTLKPYYDKAILHFGDFFATYFEHAVCGYDDAGVINKKPAPDTYLVAAKRFARPPVDMSKVLIFEDSLTGLEGAIASGGKIVLATKSKAVYAEENAKFVKKIDLIVDSLENFQPDQFGLPPY